MRLADTDEPLPVSPLPASHGFLELDGGQRLFYQLVDGGPKAPVVVYLHGIEGHSQWFAATAAALSQKGLTVISFDRRGSGRSDGLSGHLSNYRQLLDDIDQVIALAREKASGAPLFLMANCWGAKAAIVWAADRGSSGRALNGLILTSPALTVKVDVCLKTKLEIAFAWLAGLKRVFPLPLTAEMFTDNPVYLKYIQADSLRLTAASGAFFAESMKLSLLAWASAGRLTVPLFVLQAGRDAIVDSEGVKRWFNSVAGADKTMEIFGQAFHSLDFDCQPRAYRELIASWILDRARGAAE